MGLLESIRTALSGAAGPGNDNRSLGQIAATLIDNHPSGKGLAGLLEEFEQHGLGSVARSWVGTGENLPVTEEEIRQVLGSEAIQGIAAKVGITPEQISSALTHFLPMFVDKLTPDGQVPQGQELERRLAGQTAQPAE